MRDDLKDSVRCAPQFRPYELVRRERNLTVATEVDTELMTAAEFRRRYCVGTTRFYELINSGQLIALKNGARTMIAKSHADDWLRSLPGYVGKSEAA
jgi:hypothetical protein